MVKGSLKETELAVLAVILWLALFTLTAELYLNDIENNVDKCMSIAKQMHLKLPNSYAECKEILKKYD